MAPDRSPREQAKVPRSDSDRGQGRTGRLNQVRDLDDLFLDRVLDQLRLIVNVQLAHQVELVRLDGFHTEVEIAGDFFDRIALGQHFEDFALARGQGGETRKTVSG